MAIVGFTSGEKVVTEGEDFSVCVNVVTQPDPSVAMQLSFFLSVEVFPAGLCVCVLCVCACVVRMCALCACVVCVCVCVIYMQFLLCIHTPKM